MTDPALTPRMREVLTALRHLRVHRRPYGYPSTPNEIAITAGYREGGIRHGNGAARMGGWSGHMAPANRITFALIALRRRGLVERTTRRDGLSGTAYELTGAGEAIAFQISDLL